MKNIIIISSGGFAKEVAFLIDDINRKNPEWNFLGYIDNKTEKKNGKYTIYNNDNWLKETTDELYVVFGLGNPQLIEKLYIQIKNKNNLHFPNLIHPNVIGDWENIKIDRGNIICAGNIFTTDIKIGSFNVFNLDCTIGHDSVIGDFNVINPSVNISGGVYLENRVLLGTGSQILQDKKIVSDTIIGAGAVVLKNIEEKGVYIGIPAKKIR